MAAMCGLWLGDYVITMSSGFKRDFRKTDRVLGRDEYRAGKSEIVLQNGQPKPKTLGPRQLEK